MSLFSIVLDVLFPPTCVACNKPGSYLCSDCQHNIHYYSQLLPLKSASSLDGLFALGKHEPPLQNLIKHIKYYGHSDMAKTAAHLLAIHLPMSFHNVDLITAIPLHVRRERERGYNQSDILAKHLSTELHLPYQRLLQKVRSTLPQAGLTRNQRLSNLERAFRCHSDSLSGKRILLIDDVTTTGATLQEAALVLKQAGAALVLGAVLAHGR